ncbi:hypothetical protein D3C81_1345470 [compost metagenome]
MGLTSLELGNVDGVGVLRTGGDAGNLAGLAIGGIANADGCKRALPGSVDSGGSLARPRVITRYTGVGVRHRVRAQRHAVVRGCGGADTNCRRFNAQCSGRITNGHCTAALIIHHRRASCLGAGADGNVVVTERGKGYRVTDSSDTDGNVPIHPRVITFPIRIS